MTRHHYRGVALVLITFVAVACGQKNPSGPTPVPSPTPPSPPQAGGIAVTVSGSVSEHTESGEVRPVPNLRLMVRALGPTDGAIGGPPLPDIVTDANGRYEITNVTDATILFMSTAPGSDHRFLCDQYPLTVRYTRAYPFMADLPVVAATWSGDRLPAKMGIIGTSVFGVVRERIDGTLQPVSGARVVLESGLQDPAATTNANGFFMICSLVGSDQDRTITASKDGYLPVTRTYFGGWESKLDMEIKRQ